LPTVGEALLGWVRITSVTGKFACNKSLLNRKQTCWNSQN